MTANPYWGVSTVGAPSIPVEVVAPPPPAPPVQPPPPLTQPPPEPSTAKAPPTDKSKKLKKDKVGCGTDCSFVPCCKGKPLTVVIAQL